jgi:hypothetical protein
MSNTEVVLIADIRTHLTELIGKACEKLKIDGIIGHYSIGIDLPTAKKSWTAINIYFFKSFKLNIIDGCVSTSAEDDIDDFHYYASLFYPIVYEVQQEIIASHK